MGKRRGDRFAARHGRYTRSLLEGLGIPVENRYGLRPAVAKGANRIAPLTIARDLDRRGWLVGVQTFNFHMHLPHYAVTTDDTSSIRVLARQPIDLSRPHPFTEAGNRVVRLHRMIRRGTAHGPELPEACSMTTGRIVG